MAIVQDTYTGNGSTVTYSISFPYLDQADVKASLNGAATTAFTFVTANTIQFATAPGAGVTIKIYRETDDSATSAVFYAGSSIRADDLNNNFKQSLYINQETTNNVANAVAGNLTPGSVGTVALANEAVTEAKIGPGAVTSSKILNGTIVNEDISASAEVAVSKLANGTARQLLQTSSSGADVEWTSNVSVPGTLAVTGDATFNGGAIGTLKVATAVASTTGTTVEFTGIPSWAKRITFLLYNVGTSTGDELLIQLGTAAGWITTGYSSAGSSAGSASALGSTAGFLLEAGGSFSYLRSGSVNIFNVTGNFWVYNSITSQITGTPSYITSDLGAGRSGDLGAVLTRIRLTTNGSAVFNSGTVNIMYEG